MVVDILFIVRLKIRIIMEKVIKQFSYTRKTMVNHIMYIDLLQMLLYLIQKINKLLTI